MQDNNTTAVVAACYSTSPNFVTANQGNLYIVGCRHEAVSAGWLRGPEVVLPRVVTAKLGKDLLPSLCQRIDINAIKAASEHRGSSFPERSFRSRVVVRRSGTCQQFVGHGRRDPRVLRPGGYAWHELGPLYFSYGSDHCSAAYGEFEANGHVLLDEPARKI